MPWPVFWTTESGEVQQSLRRYTSSSDDAPDCAGGYHNASTVIGRAPLVRDDHGYLNVSGDMHPHDDPRWPAACACGYVFTDADEWQLDQEPIYRRPDTGEEWTQRDLPAGAMFNAFWNPPDWCNLTDGLALTVVLPPGSPDARSRFWNIDGPANSEATGLKPHAWTRTGDHLALPPTIDVNPSILVTDYHGYLHAGVLTDPL